MKILIATRNPGKLREYRELLSNIAAKDVPLEWLLLSDLNIETDVEETGQTFEENARLKAVTYAQESDLLTLADDSGLVVDALDGAPGVMSARYAGPDATDEDRYRKLLHVLEDVPDEKRTARFMCVVAVCTPEGETFTAKGAFEGRIAREPRGTHGFGYDPVFYVPELGMALAEAAPEVKNRISHRARALEAIRPTLKHIIDKG